MLGSLSLRLCDSCAFQDDNSNTTANASPKSRSPTSGEYVPALPDLNRRALFAAGALAILILCGCSGVPVRTKDGTVHHLILGLGVVSVNQSQPAVATVTRSRAIGLSATDRPSVALGLGYSSQTTTLIPAGVEDVHIEMSQRPFGPLHVNVETAEIQEQGGRHEAE